MPTCGSCSASNADDSQFCARCGAALDAPPVAPREVRKTVTVVFTDVTGSTSMGERLDPESLRRVMSRYFVTVRRGHPSAYPGRARCHPADGRNQLNR
ncbi:MAG: hypothetical protein WED12_07825 [Chloroflexota bacterium]